MKYNLTSQNGMAILQFLLYKWELLGMNRFINVALHYLVRYGQIALRWQGEQIDMPILSYGVE